VNLGWSIQSRVAAVDVVGVRARPGQAIADIAHQKNQLVHAEDGTAVASVMIGGRLGVDNRRLLP
jgi:hypothetical protein